VTVWVFVGNGVGTVTVGVFVGTRGGASVASFVGRGPGAYVGVGVSIGLGTIVAVGCKSEPLDVLQAAPMRSATPIPATQLGTLFVFTLFLTGSCRPFAHMMHLP
jgi:hypothetical protein